MHVALDLLARGGAVSIPERGPDLVQGNRLLLVPGAVCLPGRGDLI